ncbi:MAG: bifunctional rhamnulose-1-phosphate aldolase/short-chain dehydrogenase [Acidobacteriota bacterium]
MDNLWRDEEADGLRGVDLLVYRSRLIGRDPGLVLWGGGNTSIKHVETDFRGRSVRVLRIKGSGADLGSIDRSGFPGLRLDDLEPLWDREAMSDEEMVSYLAHCLMEPSSPRPSIETLLHAFVPHPHVDHTHPDAVLALTDTADGRRQVEECFGREAIWIPYRRPGFALSREVGGAIRRRPEARCAGLDKHGLIAWGPTARDSYDATIEMSTRAEEYARGRGRGRSAFGAVARPPLSPSARRRVAARLAPFVRGLLSRRESGPSRVLLRFDDGDEILEFVGSEAGPRISLSGPATPDHLLYTRSRPLFVHRGLPDDLESPQGAQALRESIAAELNGYLSWYDLYFKKHGDGVAGKLDPFPRVLLIPGIGMLTAWKDARRTLVVSDIYRHAIRVMRDAQGLGGYRSLGERESFEVEYWPLERYRLELGPPGREMASRVALVTGAASGIGRAIARRLASEDCHVVVADVDADGAGRLADDIVSRHGVDRARAVGMDVADEGSVRRGFDEALIAYGGIDVLVSNAGIAHSRPIDLMELTDWKRSFDVNATGHFLVAREAVRVLKEQGIGGSLIFVASKNVLAPGRDFGAYSAAKAAECQLARILAIEAGESGVRVNIVNPDAVFQDSRLWSSEVRAERARAHGIRAEDLEDFYRGRNLLKVRVLPEDVAEAVLWLACDRSAKTTGCIITTDGGVREAFPR